MVKTGKYIWMDGTFVEWEKAGIHPMSNTVQLGMGVFEGLRMNAGKNGSSIFRLQDHTDRFFQSVQILNMQLSLTKDQFNNAVIETAKKNKIASGYLRPLAYFGAEEMGPYAQGMKSRVLIAEWEMGDVYSSKETENGLRLHTSSFRHLPVTSVMCRAKATGNYINPILSIHEAKAAGYDDTLILDAQGCVAETSGANIFIVRKGVIYTPTELSILLGITRNSVFSIARDLNLELIVKNITRDEVYTADEMFITGTAVEIQAVCDVDGRKIGTGSIGTITKKIQQSYHKITRGLDEKYSDWLTPIHFH